jgi:hypothetical protein
VPWVLVMLVVSSFGSRAQSLASSTVKMQRFIGNFDEHIRSIVREARDRDEGRTLDFDSYMGNRRLSIAMKSVFDLILWSLEIEESILADQRILYLEQLATDMIILANVSCGFFLHFRSLTLLPVAFCLIFVVLLTPVSVRTFSHTTKNNLEGWTCTTR